MAKEIVGFPDISGAGSKGYGDAGRRRVGFYVRGKEIVAMCRLQYFTNYRDRAYVLPGKQTPTLTY